MSTEIEEYIERAERAQRYNEYWGSRGSDYDPAKDPFYTIEFCAVFFGLLPCLLVWCLYLLGNSHIADHTPFVLSGIWTIIFVPLLIGFRPFSRDFQWMCALRNRPDLREEYLDDCAPEKPIERLEAHRKATRRAAVQAMNK